MRVALDATEHHLPPIGGILKEHQNYHGELLFLYHVNRPPGWNSLP